MLWETSEVRNPFNLFFPFYRYADFFRCGTLDRSESGESNSSRDDKFDVEAMSGAD